MQHLIYIISPDNASERLGPVSTDIKPEKGFKYEIGDHSYEIVGWKDVLQKSTHLEWVWTAKRLTARVVQVPPNEGGPFRKKII